MIGLAAYVMLGGAAIAPQAAACTPGSTAQAPAGWERMVPVEAGADGKPRATLMLGQSARATLAAVAPAPSAAGSYAGSFDIAVAKAGRYRVLLGAPAWIDVTRDGATLASVAHGHGPACSGIRKMVDFDLKPGRYVVRLTKATEATMPVMVTRAP